VPDLHVSEFNDGLTEISTSENTANLPESKHAAFVRYFITKRQAFSKTTSGIFRRVWLACKNIQ
jgi:hypothetical protein